MLQRIPSVHVLARYFDPLTMSRGRAYFEQGRVLQTEREDHGDREVVTGRVRGTGNHVYRVYVAIAANSRGPSVDGDCTCPVQFNCKHVVSVLLAQLQAPASPASPLPGAPRATPGNPRGAALEAWLQRLTRAVAAAPAPAATPPQALRLLYLLQPRSIGADTGTALHVAPVVCRLLKKGGYGKAAAFSPARAWQPHVPDYVLPEDVAILRALAPDPFIYAYDQPRLSGAAGVAILERLLATGRCHWSDQNGAPLVAEETRSARPEWLIEEDGRQRLVLRIEPPASQVLPLEPPWYLDLERGSCGPLETGLPPALAVALLSAPTLEPAQAAQVTTLLEERLPHVPVPRPRPLREQALQTPPVPWLRLCTETVRPQLGRPYLFDPEPMQFVCARLGFDYGGHRMEMGDPADTRTLKSGADLVRIHRDREAERLAYGRLLDGKLIPLTETMVGIPPEHKQNLVAADTRREAATWLAFQSEVLPVLAAAGWRIEVDPGFPYALRTVDDWYAELDEERGGAWFELELGVLVEGRRVPLLPLLLKWLHGFAGREWLASGAGLAADEPLPVPLDDGTFVAVPYGRISGILETLLELHDPHTRLQDGKLQLPALRAAELDRLEVPGTSAWHWQGGNRLRELGRRLRDFSGLQPLPPPAGFTAELRPYQQEGLGWLQFLREHELGGVLADDMGLGKTVQALAHLALEKNSGRMDRPSLVVAPTSLMVNWRLEAGRFAPDLRVLTLHGQDRQRHFDHLTDADLILTTYPLLHRDQEALLATSYHLLILDEAQNIKNPRAQATQIVQRLQARHRLCLTGTPLENHLGELWSLFDFLQPGLLGDARQFRRLFRTPIEKHGDSGRQNTLGRRLAPFLLRRLKDQVAAELPAKTEIIREVELQGAQRDLYESIRIAMHDKVRAIIASQGLARSHIIVLDALLKLRQACCDPRLVALARARRVKESAKLDLLMDLLPEMVEEGRRILVFSQFTTMLALIETELHRRSLEYVKLTGQTRDRATPVARFQGGEVPIFLISLKAGGTGLNLTAADTVIHYDPWWNPAVESQATDRAHRIGQDKPVFVYKLLTAGTVEEKILALQAQKRHLADALFAEGGSGRLTAADLDALFEPLDRV